MKLRKMFPGSVSVVVGLVLALGLGCGGTEATVSGVSAVPRGLEAGRPASVPSDFVLTPHGYFHPGCVIQPRGKDFLRADGRLAAVDPATRTVRACGLPSYDRSGHVRGAARRDVAASPKTTTRIPPPGTAAAVPPPSNDGWMAEADMAFVPVRFASARWTVPQAPAQQASPSSQVLYYFPGLENASTGDRILQPVLGWYSGSWTIASWNCCVAGNVFHSEPIVVSPGQVIDGFMSGSDCAGDTCQSWNITTRNASTNQETVLDASSGNQTMNWLFGGALEVYGVTSCDQLSPTEDVVFSSFNFVGMDSSPIVPNFGTSWVLPTSPGCKYRVSASGVNVILSGRDPARVSLTDPRIFNAGYYLARYSDLRAAFGGDEGAAARHWSSYGVREGRVAGPGFDVHDYLARYEDLRAAFGNDYAAAARHFLVYGLEEGRLASRVFSAQYYLSHQTDIFNAYGYSAELAMRHWATWGISEGRRASSEFDPAYYLNANPDVAAAYGATNYLGGMLHWQLYGMNEGRRGAP